MTTRERREAKAERLQEWAAKREAKADADLSRAKDMASMIPEFHRRADGIVNQLERSIYDDDTMSVTRCCRIRERRLPAGTPEGTGSPLRLEAERDRVKARRTGCRT